MDNRISMYKLEVFRLTVDLGGVGRAAAHLYLTQPVVTAHIKSLQERMGVKLFTKSGRNLKLTEAGRSAYSWACDVARRTDEMQDDLDQIEHGTGGTARLWAAPAVGSYLLPRAVAAFAEANPAARVSMQIAQPNQVLETVEVGACDFGVLITDEIRPESGVVGEVLGWEDFVLVAAANSQLAGESVNTQELAELPFISTPDDMIMRRMENASLTSVGVPRHRVALEFGHPEATKVALSMDLGVALMFRCTVARELARGELREVQLQRQPMRVPVYLVRRESGRLTPLQSALIRQVSGVFK